MKALHKSIQIVSDHGAKCPDEIRNLMWADTYFPENVLLEAARCSINCVHLHHNLIGAKQCFQLQQHT